MDPRTTPQTAPSQFDEERARNEYRTFLESRQEYEAFLADRQQGGSLKEGSAKRSISPGAAIGSAIGGVAGGMLTAPSGGLGAIPGAIAGAAVGELAQQGYDRMTNSAYAPHSLEESAKRVGTEAAFSAAGEAVGGAITFLRPVAYAQPRQLTVEQLKTKAFLDQHQISYAPDQITGSAFHSFFRAIADNGIFSEKQMEVFAGKQHEAIRRSAVAIADTVGQKVPPDVLGQQIIKTIRNEDDTITNTVIQPLYNRIAQDLQYTSKTIQVPTGKMVPAPGGLVNAQGQQMMVPEMTDQLVTQGGLLVDQRPLRMTFQKEVADLERTSVLEKRPDLLQSAHYQSMKRFLNMPDEGQWADAHQVLKETRKSLRELDNPMNQATDVLQDKAVLTRAEKVLEQQLEVSLKNSPNPAHQQDLALWQQAQSAVKSKNERLRNDVVLRFVKAMDEHGGEKGLTPFVNTMTPDDALKVMSATKSDPALQDSIRRQYLQDKIEKAGGMADADAPFDAERFRKVLFGKDDLNARKSEVLLDPKQRQKLTEFTNAVSDIQKQNTADKFGSVFIRMKSSGAVFNLSWALVTGFGGFGIYEAGKGDKAGAVAGIGGAVGILVGPNVLARILSNPRAVEYMIQGLRYSATSNQAIRVTRELMRLDQGFANAVRLGVSAYSNETQTGPDSIQGRVKEMTGTLPQAFGLQQ